MKSSSYALVFGVILSSLCFCYGENKTEKVEEKSISTGSTDQSDKLSGLSLPSLPSIDTSSITDIKDTLYSTSIGGLNPFDLLDNFLLGFNRIPNFVAQLGNFSLLQAALLLALGGVIVGSAMLVAEAWSFKNEEDQNYYFKHRVPQWFDTSLPQQQSSSYGVPAPPSQYGAPQTPSSGGYNRRQFSPPYYYNGYQNQVPALSSYVQKDPLLFYNYAQTAQNSGNNRDNRASTVSVQDLNPSNNADSSFLKFPTFDINKKKKIMFG